jgi:hypothetical protein
MSEVLINNRNTLKQNLAIAVSALAIAGVVEHQTEPAYALTKTTPVYVDQAGQTSSSTQKPPQVFAEHHPALVYHVPKPIHLPLILKKIGGCESGHGPYSHIDYKAQNPSTTASGGFQFLDTTWANFRGYSRAKYAPPRIQKIKAIRTYHAEGTKPWYASRHCWS